MAIAVNTRVGRDRLDKWDGATIRYRTKLHYIGVGRPQISERVLNLMADPDVRMVNEKGKFISNFLLDPTVDYQP